MLIPTSSPQLQSARVKQDKSQTPLISLVENKPRSSQILSHCAWRVLWDMKEAGYKASLHLFKLGVQEALTRTAARGRKHSSRPVGRAPAKSTAQKATVGKGLPSRANTRPLLSLHIKASETELAGDRCSHLTVCSPNFSPF